MKDPRNLLIVALVAVAAFLAGGAGDRRAHGQGYPGGTADSNGSMIAVTGTIGSGVSVLWLVDTQEKRLVTYHCRGGKSIELVAARNIEWDFKIDQFHDESRYSPEHLRKLFFEGAEEGEGGIRDPDGGPRTPGDGTAPGNGTEDD
jgi:hypothetical protein